MTETSTASPDAEVDEDDLPREPHEGLFTPEQVERLRSEVGSARISLGAAIRLRDQRREAVEGGVVRAEADRHAAAWRDPAFVEAVREHEAAWQALDEARKALRRCGSRRSWGKGPTDKALERQEEERRAVRRFNEALAAYRAGLERHGLKDASPDRGGRAQSLKWTLRGLVESLRLDEAQQDVERRQALLRLALARYYTAVENEVPESVLGRWARWLPAASLKRLIECSSEGYRPREETFTRDPEYPPLAELGAIEIRRQGPTYPATMEVTQLGHAVARWSAENMPGFGGDADRRAPAMTQAELPECGFTEAERAAMIASATAWLRELAALPMSKRADLEPRDCGLPGEVTYMIEPRIGAVQNFLRVLGASRAKPDRRFAVSVAKKPPTGLPFVPGRFLSDPRPVLA